MNEYTIRCTKEQIKTALELGAPIEHSSICYEGYDIIGYSKDYVSQIYGIIPTAEQMLGFLRSKGIKFHFNDATNYWRFSKNSKIISYGWCEQKELAAIDAALDYLKTHQTT